MELFTLGIGNYTETDVRESARALTGWGLDRDFAFQNSPPSTTTAAKRFSGRTGNFTGDDIVEIIFTQPAAARWLAKKLLAFFVYNDPEPELVDAVAALIRKNDFNLQPVMSTLLRSNVFYSDRAYRALVKSPVEFVVGSYQLFGIRQSDVVALGRAAPHGTDSVLSAERQGLGRRRDLAQQQTMLTRENFASGLMAKMGDASWLQRTMTSMDPAGVARALTATILQGDVSPASTAHLTAYLDGTGVSALATLSGENSDERLRGAAYLTMAMPAYQLA